MEEISLHFGLSHETQWASIYLWLDYALIFLKYTPTLTHIHFPYRSWNLNYLTVEEESRVQSVSKKTKYRTTVRLHRITNSSFKNQRNP